MKMIICILSVLFTQCATKRKDQVNSYSELHILRNQDAKTPFAIHRSETHCSPDRAMKDLGRLPIRIEGVHGEEIVEFDFTGVSGNGLKTEYSVGAIESFIQEEHYENCTVTEFQNTKPTEFACSSIKREVNPGKPVLICNVPHDGYPRKSIENTALVNTAALIKTMRNLQQIAQDLPSNKIAMLVYPLFKRSIHLSNGENYTLYDMDNARWTNRNSKDWNFTIELLPTSHEMELSANAIMKSLLWQLGVGSHEVGHHIFASLAPRMKYEGVYTQHIEGKEALQFSYFSDPSESNAQDVKRVYGIQTSIGALDEGFADFISHLTFASSKNPYYVLLGSQNAGRNVTANKVQINFSAEVEEKALSDKILKQFFHYKRTPPAENNFNIDYQDTHAIGAILANSFEELINAGDLSKGKHSHELNKWTFIRNWVMEVQSMFLKDSEFYKTLPKQGYTGSAIHYNSGPALFLKNAVWEAVKLLMKDKNTLTQKQCEILEKKFPVYASSWKAQDTCRD